MLMRNWHYILLLAPTVCVGQIVTGVRVDEVKSISDMRVSTPTLDRCVKQIKNKEFEGTAWRDEATERVRFCLQDNGYYKASVTPEFQPLPDKGKIHHFAATFRIDPGHQYRIGEIRLRGTEPFNPSELKRLLGVLPGDILARNKIGAGLDVLRRFYSHRGYINLTPLPEVEADDDQATVVLTITLDAGRQYHVGGVEFSGVSSEVAAKLADGFEMKKGEVFDESKVEEAVSKFFRENKSILPKGATEKRNFSVGRNVVAAVVYLRFDFVEPGYLRK